jgi:hypothetical protein
MTAIATQGKGIFQSGEFNSSLLSGDIIAYFSAPAAAQKYITIVQCDMIIQGWYMTMYTSGSAVIDVWRTSIVDNENGTFTLPTPAQSNASSITGTYLPTLASAQTAVGGNVPGYPFNASSMFELGWGGAGAAAKAGLYLYAGDILVFDIVSYTAGGGPLNVMLLATTGS